MSDWSQSKKRSSTPLPHRTFKSWSYRRFDRKRLGLCVPCEIRPTVCVDKQWGGRGVLST
jgi:hypothetical protein